MMGRMVLTPRQAFVAATLYAEYGWSALQIALAAGYGRRCVENAIRSQGVRIYRGGWHTRLRRANGPDITPDAVCQWFASAREFNDPLPPTKSTEVNGASFIVFRKRRCPKCELLTTYVVDCPRCGERMDPVDRRQQPKTPDIDRRTLPDRRGIIKARTA